jgi:hypothetical protein
MAQPTGPSQLLQLPVEIQLLIFSYLPFQIDDRLPRNDESPLQKLSRCPILVVRQVCHHFRLVAAILDCWKNDEFEPWNLISPSAPVGPLQLSEHDRQVIFFEALLNDRHLARRFAKKTSWTFRDLVSYDNALQKLPGLSDNVKAIYFHITPLKDEPGRRQMTPMSQMDVEHFPTLTTLSFVGIYILNFDNIPKYFPALENLYLNNALASGRSGSSGSLEGLEHLRCLSISMPSILHHEGVCLVPLSSSGSLRSLSVDMLDEWDVDWCTGQLVQFVNLTTLEVLDLTLNVCGCMMDAKFKLVTFSTSISIHDISGNIVSILLKVNCLSAVKNLSLSLERDDEEIEDDYPPASYPPIIAAIVNLRSLQNLELHGFMLDMGWCPRFRRLEKLRSLVWRTDNVVDGDQIVVDDVMNKVKRALRNAFVSFTKKPRLELVISQLPIESGYDTDENDSAGL